MQGLLEQEISKDQKNILIELEKLRLVINHRKKLRGIDFYIPNAIQLNAHQSKAKIICIVKGNRMGGTTFGICEVVYHITKRYPDWFPRERRFNRPIKVRIATDRFFKIDSVIEPKLREYMPEREITRVRRSPQGYISKLHTRDGSSIEFLTSEQEQMAWEGQDLDFFWGDEPQKRLHWIATKRGLLDRGGYTVFTFTPLIEPWMKEELVDKADGKLIEVFYGTTRDNRFDIKGNRILKEEDIKEFESLLTDDEKETRIYGKFFHLKGLVYKELNPSVHFVNDFKYENGYPVICVLDPHDRLPHHLIWVMIDRINDIYVMYEIIKEGTVQEISALIKATEQYFDWRVVKRLIDPNFGRKPLLTTGLSVIDEFFKYKVSFIEACDEKEAGHLKVKQMLHYDSKRPLDIDNKPKLFFVRDRVPKTIHSMLNYQYDEWRNNQDRDPKETEKPKDCHGADCFDSETEVLTMDGWKKFINIKAGEFLMTYCGEYQPCSDVISYNYSGEMIKIDAPHINLLVTPNHKMLVNKSGNNDLNLCPAGNLKSRHRFPRIPQQFNSHYNGMISLSPVWTENNKKWEDERYISSELWAEFMGWYISEGSVAGTKGGKIQIPGRGYQVIISQCFDNNKKDEIASLLDKLPWRWNFRQKENFEISSKQLWEKLFPLGNSYSKRIPRDVLNLNTTCLKKLWNSLIKGDGWIRKSIGRQDREQYATVSEGLIDDIQELLLKLGYASGIQIRKAQPYKIRGKFGVNTVKQYYITPHIQSYALIRDSQNNIKLSNEYYKGMVYCATVPEHTLVVRRNKKTVVTGNCIRYLCMSNPEFHLPQVYEPVGAYY